MRRIGSPAVSSATMADLCEVFDVLVRRLGELPAAEIARLVEILIAAPQADWDRVCTRLPDLSGRLTRSDKT